MPHKMYWEKSIYIFPLAQQPNADQGCLNSAVYRSQPMTQHSRWESNGRGIGPSLTQHPKETVMGPKEFEPAMSESDRPQTLALNRSATGIGWERRVSITNRRSLS
jgi:hypothetical protein